MNNVESTRQEISPSFKTTFTQQKVVRFSDILFQVHIFEKVALKDSSCVWYGCHELQRMIDESRRTENQKDESAKNDDEEVIMI
mmetsp:Transcript_27737/g.31703  ORF Transcript_27737/g.31703 Transcript_27737/m.31703 type:complete len:84 (+) Transcript_27737:146-397(+)